MQGRRYIVFLALAISVVVLLNLPFAASRRIKSAVRDGLKPFDGVVSFIARKGRGIGWYASSAWSASDSERALQAEIAELQRELWRLRTVDGDNAELRALVGFEQQRPERLVSCEVVSRGDASGWWRTLRVNRGRADGVEANRAVVTTSGLIGHTTAVSEHTSDVLLITDPTSRVGCRLRRTGAYGILHGLGTSLAGRPELEVLYAVQPGRLDYLDVNAAIAPGEEVVTSGLGGLYPEGLPVGRVVSISADPSRLYQSAEVLPAADLRRIRYVFVLLPAERDT